MKRITQKSLKKIKEKMVYNTNFNKNCNIIFDKEDINKFLRNRDIKDLKLELKSFFNNFISESENNDKKNITDYICYLLTVLSLKLTRRETFYFASFFFEDKIDKEILKDIGTSRETLSKIKKSCIFKTYLTFYNFID